jgi:hypothetical protein
MKKLAIYLVILMVLSGCSSSIFYQLYKTESSDLKLKERALVSEHQDIDIVYNFWTDNGSSDFLIANKTDSSVYIDLGRSHLIANGMAYTYFRNRTFSEVTSSSFVVTSSYGSYTSRYSGKSNAYGYASGWNYGNYLTASGSAYSTSSGSGSATGSSASTKTAISRANSVSVIEQQYITIPPKSAKIISGFDLNASIYRDCNLILYPSKKEIKTSSFDKDNSPFNFTNLISYSFDKDFNHIKEVKNEFWISEISNYSSIEFKESYQPRFCDKDIGYPEMRFKFGGPDKFYIQYAKEPYEN